MPFDGGSRRSPYQIPDRVRQVNRSHPFAADLCSLWVPAWDCGNQALMNYAPDARRGNLWLPTVGTTPPMQAIAQGPAAVHNAAGGWSAAVSPYDPSASVPITIAYLGVWGGSITGLPSFYALTNGSLEAAYCSILPYSTNQLGYNINHNTSFPDPIINLGTLVAGQPFLAIGTTRGLADHEAMAINLATGAVTSGTSTTNLSTVNAIVNREGLGFTSYYAFSQANYSSYVSASSAAAFLWNRGMSSREMREFIINGPWVMLAPRQRQVRGYVAGGGGATAPGATVTAGSLVASGAATAASTAPGDTRTASASLIAGSAIASSSAAGSIVAATVGVLAGATTSASTAPTALLAATPSLVAGAASAASTASGVAVVAAASVISGSAAAGTVAAGSTVTATAALMAGSATAASVAGGATIAGVASIIAGLASGTGNATASGVTLSVGAALAAGSVTSSSAVGGITVSASASIAVGTAASHATISGTTVTATLSAIPGSATGAGNGAAAGASLAAIVSLIAGSPIVSATASGVVVSATGTLLPGVASASHAAPGMIRGVSAGLSVGTASASSTAPSILWLSHAALFPGDAYDSSASTAPGSTPTIDVTLLAGRPQAGSTNRGLPTEAMARSAATGALPRSPSAPAIRR